MANLIKTCADTKAHCARRPIVIALFLYEEIFPILARLINKVPLYVAVIDMYFQLCSMYTWIILYTFYRLCICSTADRRKRSLLIH